MPEYPPKLHEVLEDFESINDRSERSEMLIYYADRFESVPEHIATRPFNEAHRVPACESEAYVWSTPRRDGTLDFFFAVENPQGLSAQALSRILAETVSGAPLDQVASIDPSLVLTLFGNDLSMGKGQGLMGIVSMVRAHALAQLKAS